MFKVQVHYSLSTSRQYMQSKFGDIVYSVLYNFYILKMTPPVTPKGGKIYNNKMETARFFKSNFKCFMKFWCISETFFGRNIEKLDI